MNKEAPHSSFYDKESLSISTESGVKIISNHLKAMKPANTMNANKAPQQDT